jgi:galactonate dehydratase
MKITAIKTFMGVFGSRPRGLLKVETDEGIYGWGESGLSGREQAVAGAVLHYREFLIGRDPRDIGRLWQEMYRSQYFEGGRVLTAAISAIDVALHDVVGKALGVPVYQLLGGKQRELIPCFATTGAPDLETLVANCKLLLEKGWDVIRTGMVSRKKYDDERLFEPRETIGITASWLTELRQELGH